jgi:hypothetical protein
VKRVKRVNRERKEKGERGDLISSACPWRTGAVLMKEEATKQEKDLSPLP